MNSDSKYPPTASIKTYKEVLPHKERLALLLQENLSSWENTFARDLFLKANSSGFRDLSVKQEDKLREIEAQYGLSRYIEKPMPAPPQSAPPKDTYIPKDISGADFEDSFPF